jgi:hypothetical protein
MIYTYKTSTKLFASLGIGIKIDAPLVEIFRVVLLGKIVTTGVLIFVLLPGIILIPNRYSRLPLPIGKIMLIGNVKLFVGGISAIF